MKKIVLLILLFFLLQINVYANNTDLLELKVNGQDVSCSGYSCEVEVDSKSAKLTYKKGENVKDASPYSGYSVNFDNEHSVQVEVEYFDGTKVNYTVKIIEHVKSSDNTLASLIINDEEVELKENIFVYSFDTEFNTEVVKVVGKTTDSNASCSDKEYEFDLESSSLSIEYPVTAENGDIRNYTIVLKRKNKPDTTLKTLTLSNIEIKFDPNVLDYEVSVPYEINTTEVKAIANNQEATVSIKMEESFIIGENFINIIVTNDKVEDTYTIKINRLENVDESLANLKKLEIEGIEIDFDPNILEYDLYYKEIPNKLEINALSNDETGQVFIEENENLEDGSTVLVKVKLENGITRTYKLNIKLEVEEENNKILIIVLICLLVVVMIVLLVLQLKEGKGKKTKKVSKKKKVEKDIEEIEDIEII